MMQITRRIPFGQLLALGVVAALAAGCGGDFSPTSPTMSQGGPSFGTQSTAAVWGQLLGGGGSAASATSGAAPVAAAMSGVQVTVQGTGITTTTNGNGQFLLNGVPNGNVVLLITGGGTNASLTLNGVGNHQLIQIVVQVQANSATVVNQFVEELHEFDGDVVAIDAGTLSFTLDDGTVIVTDGTTWWDGAGFGSFGEMAASFVASLPIHAEGLLFTMNGGTQLATVVRAQTEAEGVEAFRLRFNRDKWSLGWVDNGSSGNGSSAIEAYISNGPFADILPSSVEMVGPDGTVTPFATGMVPGVRFEARFTKSQAISVATSVPPGDTVEVIVRGTLVDGTPWELTATIEISDDDDDDLDDDDDGNNQLDPAVAEQAIGLIQDAIAYLDQLVSSGLMSANNAKSLVTKLESAIASLEKLNGNPAANKLGAFLNSLDSAEKTGKIDEGDAAYLEQLIQFVIDLIEGDA